MQRKDKTKLVLNSEIEHLPRLRDAKYVSLYFNLTAFVANK